VGRIRYCHSLKYWSKEWALPTSVLKKGGEEKKRWVKAALLMLAPGRSDAVGEKWGFQRMVRGNLVILRVLARCSRP